MPNDIAGQRLPEGCLIGTASTLSPVLLNDTVRRSFAYHKLPQQLLKLSVLKLDGSFFEVQVRKTATVAELKKAVEDVFSQLPEDKETKFLGHMYGVIFAYAIRVRS
ncbi:hypothetical protein L484_008959 [Morus notabilis]|uniref:SNRNP25 ubiquitin-like domain-containing protein n=1 Tax=Morus notabilis TaxID=981085 RepID=W9SIT2_9ROSA|nr:hypothetical protein L484_008959 [Morus notabilis]